LRITDIQKTTTTTSKQIDNKEKLNKNCKKWRDKNKGYEKDWYVKNGISYSDYRTFGKPFLESNPLVLECLQINNKIKENKRK
jgi:hypothetical protein